MDPSVPWPVLANLGDGRSEQFLVGTCLQTFDFTKQDLINLEVANEAVDMKVDDLIPDGSRCSSAYRFHGKPNEETKAGGDRQGP